MTDPSPPPGPALWERQPGERPRAFERFLKYRAAGRGRSLEKTAAELGVYPRRLEEQSSRWRWVERAEAWDAYLDRRAQEAEVVEEAERRRRERIVVEAAKVKVAQAVEKMVPEDLRGRGVVYAIDALTRLSADMDGVRMGRKEVALVPAPPAPAEEDLETPRTRLRRLLETDPEARRLADELGYRLAGRDAGAAGGGDVGGGVAPDPASPLPRPDAGGETP